MEGGSFCSRRALVATRHEACSVAFGVLKDGSRQFWGDVLARGLLHVVAQLTQLWAVEYVPLELQAQREGHYICMSVPSARLVGYFKRVVAGGLVVPATGNAYVV